MNRKVRQARKESKNNFASYAVNMCMEQPIIGFHQDEAGDWVADLACGHTQHVRHNPPLSNRPWVLTAEGRQRFLGVKLNCKRCDEKQQA